MIYATAANQSISVGGTAFAYRDTGPRTGVPLILLNHCGRAVLDNFDPRIVKVLAVRRWVIASDYRRRRYRQGRPGLLALDDQGIADPARPQVLPFFTTTANGPRAVKAFLQRLQERKADKG